VRLYKIRYSPCARIITRRPHRRKAKKKKGERVSGHSRPPRRATGKSPGKKDPLALGNRGEIRNRPPGERAFARGGTVEKRTFSA